MPLDEVAHFAFPVAQRHFNVAAAQARIRFALLQVYWYPCF